MAPVPMVTPLLLLLSIAVFKMATGTEQVIDIFTNYPNTVEVLKDYNRLLENRQGSQKQLLESKATVTTLVNNKQHNMARKTRSKLNLYDYNKYDRYYDNRNSGNQYGHADQGYWDGFHDFDDIGNHHGGGGGTNDVLESEFGVFEETAPQHDDYGNNKRKKHKNKFVFHHHQDGGGGDDDDNDVASAASVGHFVYDDYHSNHQQTTNPPPSQNLIDLNNFIAGMGGITATRPSFLTTAHNHQHHHQQKHNRRNKTSVVVNDYFDFDDNGVSLNDDDGLESDFGEIVAASSSTVNKVKKNHKGKIKRIPKPVANNNNNGQNKNHIALAAAAGSKLKVTNLLRKYLVKMHRNKTRQDRKHSNDRTFTKFYIDGDDKTGSNTVETSVKLPGAEKYLLGNHQYDYTGPLETIKNKTKLIANKFLSLFTVIQFANARCQANSAVSQYEGTCYLATECAEKNGVAMGLCAEGHGVCCVFRGTCGGVGSNNCTYFESPGYPNYFPPNGGVITPTTERPTSSTNNPLTPDPRLKIGYRQGRQSDDSNALSCIFKVYKASDDVKQMRIDFIDLELAGPTAGQCIDERLIITGTGLSTGVPTLCGYNTGQHVYVDVSSLSGPLQLSVLANMIARKRYKLRICQYTDGCSGLMNCLQSYTGRTGVISSFNYDQAATFSRSTPGYLNNLNYAICIKREPGYCSVTYSNVGPDGNVYPFQLRNFDEDGLLTVPQGQAGAGVINCPDDYIVINGIRLCGDRLNDGALIDDFTANAPVTDTSGGPIILPVRTSSSTTARGFKLFYTQNPCTTTGGAAGTPDPRM